MKKLVGEGKPFHSAVDKTAALLKRKVGTGAEFMKELMGVSGVKPTELQERGLTEIMGMPRMTHDQFMANLATRPAPKIREKVLGGDQDDPNWIGPYHYQWTLPGGDNYREMLIKAPKGVDNQEKIMELEAKLRRARVTNNEEQDQWNSLYNQIRDLRAQEAASPQPFQGVGSHFGGEPGILASMRLKDRLVPDLEGPHNVKVIEGGKFTNVKHPTREAAERFADVKHQGGYKTEITPLNNKKYLHLEELQSDWHQQGREHGYKDPQAEQKLKQADELKRTFDELNKRRRILHEQALREPDAGPRFDSLMEEANGITPKLLALNSQMHDLEHFKRRQQNAIPDAPFKKNWEEMALKRLIHHAAEKGYHGVVVTPGVEQAKRYNIGNHIGYLGYHPEEERLKAYGHDRREVMNQTGIKKEDLPNHIGKEVADRLLKAPQVLGTHQLEGEDIHVGGKGMKGFYDTKVPNILNSIGKKYGVKTQLGGHRLKGSPEDYGNAVEKLGIAHIPMAQLTPEQNQKIAETADKRLHHFPITEDMRKDVLTNGLPLYAEGGIIHKAEGGSMDTPDLAQSRLSMNQRANPALMDNIGINEALDMSPKTFISPEPRMGNTLPVGGVEKVGGLPIGGVDQSSASGMQFAPQALQGQQQAPDGTQGGLPPSSGASLPTQQQPSNMLSLTPQGRALGAMAPQGMAKGGIAKQRAEIKFKLDQLAKGGQPKKVTKPYEEIGHPKRVLFRGEGYGNVKGIVVPRHMWEGNKASGNKKIAGMGEINEARAKVYGSENRDPLHIGQVGTIHRKVLKEHFAKPLNEQLEAEETALARLKEAKHIGQSADTLDKSEKLDTVNHEYDDKGRSYKGFASKGVAGSSLYTSGHGENRKFHIINTCPGQTTGCGGGHDEKGIVDTMRGTCFAPNAESQYSAASVRRAAHEQAKHDPAMTSDWILAHTGSLRDAARVADKQKKRLLFRPNVVDETDVSSRHVLRHLNEQRKKDKLPPITANLYGKTNELHDPENGYHVTHSNVGPKVKKGEEIAENINRDKARVQNTVMGADNKGDFVNEQGHKTPPKGSYMVTDVKRGSQLGREMAKHLTHAKYWGRGVDHLRLSEEERKEGPEGHFGPDGKPTTPDEAHYGHITMNDKHGTPLRFDYQKQHILHPRLVNVPERKKNKKTGEMETVDHMIPTDSRFKDEDYLPKNRFMTKNGKKAGHILMTTPTESTSTLGAQTSFTHHVGPEHIEHAKTNKGEYEIDSPAAQIQAEGKEYVAPQPIQILKKTKKFALGGVVVADSDDGLNDDDFHAFPERNFAAQHHLANRMGVESVNELHPFQLHNHKAK